MGEIIDTLRGFRTDFYEKTQRKQKNCRLNITFKK